MTAKCRSVYPRSQSKEAAEVVAHNRPKPRKIEQKAVFPIALALAAIILVSRVAAQTQDGREEGPIGIEKCRTIDKPGSYKLVRNLTGPLDNGDCLVITASFVTIDLAGFSIEGGGFMGLLVGTGILAVPPTLVGIAVRNGSIFKFANGVDLGSGGGSLVEGLRVSGLGAVTRLAGDGITATGIVKGNNASGYGDHGIRATGIVTGNIANGNIGGITVGAGNTVIGNIVGVERSGLSVDCPSNVTDNTVVGRLTGLELNGTGCNNTNNVVGP